MSALKNADSIGSSASRKHEIAQKTACSAVDWPGHRDRTSRAPAAVRPPVREPEEGQFAVSFAIATFATVGLDSSNEWR